MTRLLQWRARKPFIETSTGWLRYIKRYKPRTQVHYRMVIGRFVKFAPVYVSDLKAIHIDTYITQVLQKFTNRTANAHLTALKSFCRWLAGNYDVPNPCRDIKMLDEDPPKARALNNYEYQKVLDVSTPKEREIIKFLAHTGLRIAEFRQLNWDNISHDRRFIKLIGKGRRQRLIPLNQTCQTILSNGFRNPNSKTIDFSKSYISRDKVYRLCQKLAKKAKIPGFGPHALRHYFSTIMYVKGVPIQFISSILGHADTKTTEKIYVHLWPPRDLFGVTDCLDNIHQ